MADQIRIFDPLTGRPRNPAVRNYRTDPDF
jgi:hypothetical protein